MLNNNIIYELDCDETYNNGNFIKKKLTFYKTTSAPVNSGIEVGREENGLIEIKFNRDIRIINCYVKINIVMPDKDEFYERIPFCKEYISDNLSKVENILENYDNYIYFKKKNTFNKDFYKKIKILDIDFSSSDVIIRVKYNKKNKIMVNYIKHVYVSNKEIKKIKNRRLKKNFIQRFIKTLTGKTITLDLSNDDTIRTLHR